MPLDLLAYYPVDFPGDEKEACEKDGEKYFEYCHQGSFSRTDNLVKIEKNGYTLAAALMFRWFGLYGNKISREDYYAVAEMNYLPAQLDNIKTFF